MVNKHISQVYIKVNGQNMPSKYYDSLMSVEVDDSLYLPDMFTIHVRDKGLAEQQEDFFKAGQTIEISIKQENSQEKVKLMEGEITSVEPDSNGADRSTLQVRGYDRSHKLTRIRKTDTYKQVKD